MISMFLINWNWMYSEVEDNFLEKEGSPSEELSKLGFSQRNENRNGTYVHVKETPTKLYELSNGIETLYEK